MWSQPPWWGPEEPPKELFEESEETHLSIRDCPVTFAIILINVAVFIFCLSVTDFNSILLTWGFTPNAIMQPSSILTLITYMFLHANILHLFFNMVVFFVFGYLCERKVKPLQFLTIYFVSGISAPLFHTLFNMGSDIPLVGASGAIYGILAVYGLLYARDEVAIGWRLHRIAEVPAIFGVFLMFLLETLYAVIGWNPYVGHLAHIGGGIGGVLMSIVIFPEESAQGISDLFEMILPIPETREYEDKDYHDLLAIMENSGSPDKATVGSEAETTVTKIGKGHIWVAEINGKAAGFMLLTPQEENLLYVDTIKVKPSYQETSVDISLMKKAIEIAKEKKFLAIGVRAEAENRDLIRFLVQKNLQVVGRSFDLYGKGKDALLLRKQLRK